MTPSDLTGIICDLGDPALLVELQGSVVAANVRQDYFNGPHSNWWVSRSAHSLPTNPKHLADTCASARRTLRESRAA